MNTRFTRYCQGLMDQIRVAADSNERLMLERKLADAMMGKPFDDAVQDEPIETREPGDEVAEDLGF